jgi:hypothetical protein
MRLNTVLTVDPSFYKNFLQSATSLQAVSAASNPTWPTYLTAKGLPNGTLPTEIFGTFSLPSNTSGSETFVLAWKGTATKAGGAIKIGTSSPGFTVSSDPGSVVISSGINLMVSGTDGYVELNFGGTPHTTGIVLSYQSGATFSSMTQLMFCRKADYSKCLNPTGPGDLIGDDFVNAWAALNPKIARMQGAYGVSDNCNITQWKYRPDWAAGIFWTQGWLPSLWAGQATGTNSYTVGSAPDTPAALTHGEIIQCYFQNPSNATGQTIVVAGRGAGLPILLQNGAALSAGGITANQPSTLIYDDLLASWLYYPGYGYGASLSSVPVETCVAFCNRVGCHMWLNVPAHMTTKNSTMEPTNSVTQMVSYVSANLQNNLYLEYSNEIWNASGNIGLNTGYAVSCGAAFGFPAGNNRYSYGFYGYKICVIAPLARAAWTSTTSKLKIVLALQAFGPTGTGGSTNVYRLQGADLASVANGGQGNATWISYTGNANFTGTGNRPVDLVDTLSYATYWSGTQCTNFDANYAPSYANNSAPAKTITGISTSSSGQPGVITLSADPGYSTGTRIALSGITQTGSPTLSGMNVTLTKLTATTYSMYTDVTLATPVDTSAFGYTSGGASKSYPTISGLTAWADLYATGTAANIASALSSLDTDIQGSNNGQTTSGLNANIYPAWETIAASYDGARPPGKSNLTIELYEGACEANAPGTGACTTLGISTSYSTSIADLLTGYKQSEYFYNRCWTVHKQFAASNATGRELTSVWFLFTPKNQWSMGSGADIYTTPYYMSYDAAKNLNTSKRRLFVGT